MFLTRRWLVFALVVGLLTWLAVELGDWQFQRLAERETANTQLARNLDAAPLPINELLAVGRPPNASDEWRQVTVTGTWDEENSVVVRYRTRKGKPGVDVVTPLRTDQGAVLVDRGWMQTDNDGSHRPDLPPATDGQVTVTGRIRLDATGDSTAVTDLSTRAISSKQIAKTLPYVLYCGFLDLVSESPTPEHALEPLPLPEQSNGPHFFYGLQWWFFGALAVFGFFYLAWDERRRLREARASAQAPTVSSTN